ncbi:MAG: hypothetical protein QM753_17930 [Thermomicrobiales bacterium]
MQSGLGDDRDIRDGGDDDDDRQGKGWKAEDAPGRSMHRCREQEADRELGGGGDQAEPGVECGDGHRNHGKEQARPEERGFVLGGVIEEEGHECCERERRTCNGEGDGAVDRDARGSGGISRAGGERVHRSIRFRASVSTSCGTLLRDERHDCPDAQAIIHQCTEHDDRAECDWVRFPQAGFRP